MPVWREFLLIPLLSSERVMHKKDAAFDILSLEQPYAKKIMWIEQ